jgi:hypothetical protein
MPFNFPGGEAAPDLRLAMIFVIAGLLLGGAGHVVQSRILVLIGIIVFFAGATFPILAGVTQ